jgi:hypothetical protein
MGEFLSTPIRDKVSEDNENEIVKEIINNLYKLVKIRSMWYARMEKKNGRFSYH